MREASSAPVGDVTAGAPPSGRQHVIRYGDQVAVVVEVGGGIRTYDVGDLHVLNPYPLEAMCDGAHGAPLIPWPNRLADGRYSFDGANYQVALNEPEQRNAIHGFLRWRSWQAEGWDIRSDRDAPDHVVMRTTLRPLEGYPFALDVQIDYRLGEQGLTVTTTATNVGDRTCPYGNGHHPYLSAGGGLVDDCVLSFKAGTRILTDDRQIPSGTEKVAGTAYDFADPRRVGDTRIDFAFADLPRDAERHAGVTLTRPDGSSVELWADESYPYLELYTGDTLSPERQRTGLGVEPMTLPPNGLASCTDVIRLEPGKSKTTVWGARLLG